MYSETELEAAVAAGALSAEAAAALRQHAAQERATPAADEEQFRLVTGFNDIFVAIAGILVLVGAGWLGASIATPLGPAAVAAAAWAMAEFFTRRRRMALPSIVFVLAFVGGVYVTGVSLYPTGSFWQAFSTANSGGREFLLVQAASAAVVVAACWVHWQRFKVPITIALAVGAVARLAFTLIAAAAYPNVGQWLLYVVLAGGLAIFAYAMHWDMQDRTRQTRRSDVAFWLHLAASPLIVHPIFVLMGLNLGIDEGSATATVAAVLAILIYLAMAVVALTVDRRAILVSALAYVLVAAVYLVSRTGATGAGFAVAIIVIGSGLLMMSAFWQPLRRAVLPRMPVAIRDRVPPTGPVLSPLPA